MMKRIASFLILLALTLSLAAQNISVASFNLDEKDLTANLAGTSVEDQNGQKCALLRIQTTEKGFTFDVGVLGIQKVDDSKVGEIWVYVPAGVRRITIRHQQLGTLKDYTFPINIVSARTYSMQLTTAHIETIVKPTITQQYVRFTVVPNDAIVELDGDILETNAGVATKRKAFGTYNYTVQSRLYHTQTGQVTVNDPKNRHEVHVELKPAFGYIEVPDQDKFKGARIFLDNEYIGTAPLKSERIASGSHQVRLVHNLYSPVSQTITIADGQTHLFAPSLSADFATLTLSVDGNAEIWINDQLKGKGTWTGDLATGDYQIESRLASHRSTRRELAVTPELTGQTITLTAPSPIYGTLDINSTPTDADIYIDGTKVGTTPMLLPECLIGQHTIKISKPGHSDYTTTITLDESATQDINCRLESGRPITITAPEGADIYIDNQKAATTRYEGSLAYGDHTIYAAQAGKKTDVRTLNVPMGSGALQTINLAFMKAKTFTVNGVQFIMMPVEAGTFAKVTLTNNYYIGQTEVTQALWKAVMGSNPSNFKGDNRPVETVSWNDCQTFITKLNSLIGQKFRLPTEAEWEYAARGGKKSQGYRYSGSNNLDEVAWYKINSNSQTHDVAKKQPNELGVYDMSGNVWEWCQDWKGSYSSTPQTNPTGATSGSFRVFRGGSWFNYARFCRSSDRGSNSPDFTDSGLGLRLVLSE